MSAKSNLTHSATAPNFQSRDLVESRSSHTLYDVAPELNGVPPAMHHAVSDPISSAPETSYEVRPCRVQDTDSIDTLMRNAWPDEPEWRNPQYWTKQFIKPTSARHGYVIEEVGSNYNNNDESKDSLHSHVIGFAMYKWSKPSSYGCSWYTNDFNTSRFKWKYGLNDKESKHIRYNNLYYNNKNLKENWHKLSSHIVHITDVAIHPHHRGKGLGTQLMQSMIYSFPNKTRFGLEVKTDNYGGIKCYQKCGFEIKRTIAHYYERGESAHKMVLISKYTDDDIYKFITTTQLKRCAKERENVRKQLQHFHVNNIMSKVPPKESEEKEDIEMTDKYCNETEKTKKELKRLCGDDWTLYFQKFCDQEVHDEDLIYLTEEDLKRLIPKIGPRSRVRNWIEGLKKTK